jgi:nucleoid DNA-binding protein
MADPKTCIKRLLFPKRKQKPVVSDQWYRKNAVTVNAKLRQEIMDVLPFDTDKAQADRILHAIFDSIVEGLIRDGDVLIPGLGRFFVEERPGRWNGIGKKFGSNTVSRGKVWKPPKLVVKFRISRSLRKRMTIAEREADGNQGTDQGT